MNRSPRTPARTHAPRRRARFAVVLACLLASGLIPPHADAAAVPAVPTELAPIDESGHDAETESAAPARHVRHAPTPGTAPTALPPADLRAHDCAPALHLSRPAARGPVAPPLRC